jgi:hypothetical protein
MKRSIILLAAVAIGCQPASRPQDAPMTKGDLLDLEKKIAETKDGAFLHSREVTEKIGRLESRVAALESTVKTQDVHIRALEDKIAQLRGAGAGAGQPDVTQPPMTAEDAIKEVDNQLARLRNGFRPEEVAKSLQPIAKYAAPKLCETLKSSFRDIDLMRRVEQVLAKLPASDLKIPIEDSLKDRVARYPAARVVGEVGNKELSRTLEAYTSDADLDFGYLVGSSLVRCRNRVGVPALIRVLRSEDKNTRFLAISALRPIAGENTLSYDFQKTPEQNGAAIKAWEEWYDQNGAKLFE